ncbi:protein MRG1 isoform X4 [Salvia hispanica]|nr:protein MRG1 isoform X4 [Salvia hispanica]
MSGDIFSITLVGIKSEHVPIPSFPSIYQTWSWDEWVGMDRLMKYTEENIMKQQALDALDKKAGVDKNTKLGRSAQTKPKSSTDAKVDKEEAKTTATKGKKRKADSGIEDNPTTENLIKIHIPPSLKKRLVNDWEFITQQNKVVCFFATLNWEFITQQNKLVKLPRSPNVDDILTKYLEHRLKNDGMMTDVVGEILNGLRCYFDKALPAILLYKKERLQYREAISDNTSPSTIYGAEHLLRLFVKLPELLAYVKIDEETLIRLRQRLLEFIKFLQNNESAFFLSAYDGPKVTEGGGKMKDS